MYFEKSIKNCLKERGDLSLPQPSHLARAIVLLAYGESRDLGSSLSRCFKKNLIHAVKFDSNAEKMS